MLESIISDEEIRGAIGNAPENSDLLTALGNPNSLTMRHISRIRAALARRYGADSFVPLDLGSPSYQQSRTMRKAMHTAIDLEASKGSGDFQGNPELKRAILSYFMQRVGGRIEDPQVVTVSGAQHGNLLLFYVLSLLNDEKVVFLLPKPGFLPIYEEQIALATRGNYKIDYYNTLLKGSDYIRSVREAHDRHPGYLVVTLINDPLNPTGRLQTDKERKGIADVVREHDGIIMADDAYARMVRAEFEAQYGHMSHYWNRVISVLSTSKIASNAGGRIGGVIIPGELAHTQNDSEAIRSCFPTLTNPTLLQLLIKSMHLTVIKPGAIEENGVIAHLEGAETRGWDSERDSFYRKMYDKVTQLFEQHGFTVYREGGYGYVMVGHQGYDKDSLLTVDLLRCGIGVAPSSALKGDGKTFRVAIINMKEEYMPMIQRGLNLFQSNRQ